MFRPSFSFFGVALLYLAMTTGVNAASFQFTPLTATNVSVPINQGAVIEYNITNTSKVSRTFTFQGPKGVISAVGNGLCGSSNTLEPQKSCKLRLKIYGDKLGTNPVGGFSLCFSGTTTCFSPPTEVALVIKRVLPISIIPTVVDSNNVSLSRNEVKELVYTVKNNTVYPLTLHWMITGQDPGISQLTTQANDCAASFKLNSQKSCNLRIKIDGATLSRTNYGPEPIVICDARNIACYLPAQKNWLKIAVTGTSFTVAPAQASAYGGYPITLTASQNIFDSTKTIQVDFFGQLLPASYKSPTEAIVNVPNSSFPSGMAKLTIFQEGIYLGTVDFVFVEGNISVTPSQGLYTGGYDLTINNSGKFNTPGIQVRLTDGNGTLHVFPVYTTPGSTSAKFFLPVGFYKQGKAKIEIWEDTGKFIGDTEFTFTS